jgi:hypothetical protein
MAMTEDFVSAKVADNIQANKVENNAKRNLGRRTVIEDGRLWGNRDHLVWLFEVTWADVGAKLAKIKTPAQVYDALKVSEQQNRQNLHYVTQILLRQSSSPATAKLLNERRRQLDDLHKSTLEADGYRQKCRESLELADRAASPGLSEGEKVVVEEERARRAKKFAEAEAEHNLATSREEKMEQLLRDGEAYFARAEFARFLRSNRYRLTPVNVANALAGLPIIGWRQSAKRCKGQACPGANGLSIQVFETIRRIIQSGTRRSELVKHAERWLRTQRNTKSLGVPELRKSWYYLRWSIKTVLEASPRVPTRELPHEIAREYWGRKNRPSNVDLLFADDESIVNWPSRVAHVHRTGGIE